MDASSTTGVSSPMLSENTLTPSKTPLSSSKSNEGQLAEIMSDSFPPFDTQTLVVQPFDEEAALDARYESDLSDALLKAILKTHAWAAARHKHEATLEALKLEAEISHILEIEQEQGTSRSPESSRISSSPLSVLSIGVFEKARARLADFVRRMKTAIAVLTDSDMML